jgi:ribosome-binding protein aMBF1 (putative translation factor)
MKTTSLKDIRHASPPPDGDEYKLAYVEADLAGRLADLVYTLRTAAGLTQTELAKRMGTTQSSISRLEGAAHVPTLDVLVRLGAATGTPIAINTSTGHTVHLNTA